MPAPEGNDFAVGNSGGGAPIANQNAAKHQLTADPAKVLEWLERERPDAYRWVEGKHASYLEDAPFDAGSAKADQLAQVCVCEYILWKNRGIQLKDGLVTQTHIKGSDGELVEIEDERPENQAVNRMDRQVVSKLKTLGVYDDPDSQLADAVGQLENDDYVIDVGPAADADDDVQEQSENENES